MVFLSNSLRAAVACLSIGRALAWTDASQALFEGPRIVLLHSATDDTQCLALPDDTPGSWERLIMKECRTGDKSMRWRLTFGETTISPAVDSQPWCVDAGKQGDIYARVSVDSCDDSEPLQQWYYSDDKHLAVYDQGRCLDLKDGNPEWGGWLQTIGASAPSPAPIRTQLMCLAVFCQQHQSDLVTGAG